MSTTSEDNQPRPLTVGVVIERASNTPPPAAADDARAGQVPGALSEKQAEDLAQGAFRAGVVWGAIPWIAGSCNGATPEDAVAALEARLRKLGYEPEVVVFEDVETARVEGSRRCRAKDVLRTLHNAFAELPGILAPGDNSWTPDARDQEVKRSLQTVINAVGNVSDGIYETRKQEAAPPIACGRLVCTQCGPADPASASGEAYFKATADALVTAFLSPTGVLTGWKDPHVSQEEFRELECASCGTHLGDLTLDDLHTLEPDDEEGG